MLQRRAARRVPVRAPSQPCRAPFAVAVRAPCADESRRSRRITPSCSSSSARSSWRRPSSRWRRVATASRCAATQRAALRRGCLLRQTRVVATDDGGGVRGRRRAEGAAGHDWVLSGCSRGTLRVLEGRGRAKGEAMSRLVLPPTRVPLCSSSALVSGNRPSALLAPDSHDYL